MLGRKHNVALTSISKMCFQVFSPIFGYFSQLYNKIGFSHDNWLTFTIMASNRSVILIFSCFDVMTQLLVHKT